MKRSAYLLPFSLAFAVAACSPVGGRDGPSRGGGMPPGDRGESGPRTVSASGGGSYVMELTQRQLSETALALRLTPRQQVLWDAYQARIGALMADQMRVEFGQAMRRGALQQIDAKVDTVRNRLAAMEDIAAASRLLYQSLDEKQKEIADQRLAATVPALYSGLGDIGNGGGRESGGAMPGGMGGRGGGPGRGMPSGGMPGGNY